MAKTVMTLAERMQIHGKLREVLDTHEDGTCSFKDEWNDDAVAQALNPERMRDHHVETVRMAMFGKLRAKSAPRTPEQRMAEMERQLMEQDARIKAIEDRLFSTAPRLIA